MSALWYRKKLRLRAGFILFVVLAVCQSDRAQAEARALNIDLAQSHINITTGFTGALLSVFGTRKGRGDVVIILEGPLKDSIVRRKENVAGAWINRSWLKFKDVPVYYDYAHSRENEEDLLPESERLLNHIGFESFKSKLESNRYDSETVENFQNALIRNKQKRHLFPLESQDVRFIDDHFFRVDFRLPSNVPRGEYVVRALLVENGKVTHATKQKMTVAQVGFSSSVYSVAHNESLLYGVLCVFVACVAGWLSNVFVRRN
ncbi:MAG: TIGR02186 family protein [Alphaproteobacteria bacterium]|nr:TIGR02186 family protein [Alphaproteobacteria bacterium]